MVRGFAPGLEPPPLPPPPTPSWPRRQTVTIGLALVGGLFAVLGAFIEESRSGAGILLAVVLAPVIEEALKPSGVIWLLEKRPHYLLSPVHVVVLCILGALVFATLENLVYVYVYMPMQDVDAGQTAAFARFRFVICSALHVTCSAILGIGLGRQLVQMRREKLEFDLERSLPFVIAAVALHGAYNFTVYLLERAGWRPWLY